MARLNKNFDSDENSLDPPVISHGIPASPRESTSTPTTSQEKHQSQTIPHGQKGNKASPEEGLQIPSLEPIKSFTSNRSDKKTLRRQRPLTPLYVNLLTLPTLTAAVRPEHGLGFLPGLRNDKPRTLISKSKMKTPAKPINSATEFQIGSSVWEGRQYTKDLSDYVHIDLTSETDDGTRGYFLYTPKEAHKPPGQKLPKVQLLGTESKFTQKSGLNFLSIDVDTAPSKNTEIDISVAECSLLKAGISPEFGDPQPVIAEKDHLIVGHSPSISKSQRKYESARSPTMSPKFSTASTVESNPKTQSTSKSSNIPIVNGFHSQDVNGQLNPRSPPRKAQTLIRAKGLASGSELFEIAKTPVMRQDLLNKSPGERDIRKIQQKRSFDKEKYSLGALFLKDIDLKINNGKLEALAASTGGIKLIWSKKLTSTAGRANWRREIVQSTNSNEEISTAYRHHAFIELAEKIIDGEDRLLNVIAHEYCHLANFMISGVKNKPHGKEFKEWARKVTLAFSYLPIKEYKRHSRSIDLTRQRCGKCSARLIQIKPSPRIGKGERAGQGHTEVCQKRGKYQDFVKMNFAIVRKESPGLGMAGWMMELGRRFREEKFQEAAEACDMRNTRDHSKNNTDSEKDMKEMARERLPEAEGDSSVMIEFGLLSIK